MLLLFISLLHGNREYTEIKGVVKFHGDSNSKPLEASLTQTKLGMACRSNIVHRAC